MVLFLYQILRVLLFPLIWIYSFSLSDRRRRYRLERKLNRKRMGFMADYIFEVSSEGELEQVQSLIEDYIESGKRIELIFSSDSVVHKCEELQARYPKALNIFAFPFLSYFPWGLGRSLREVVTAPHIFMCRYDFFPEILEVCKDRELVFIAATSKSLEQAGGVKRWWYRQFFQYATKLVTSTKQDTLKLMELYPDKKFKNFDFRKIRIMSRFKNKDKKFNNIYLEVESLRLKRQRCAKNLILGSLWEADLDYLSNDIWKAAKNGELLVYILPHRLDQKNIDILNTKIPKSSNIVIETQKGILCELYSEFDNAFVGGGYLGSPGVHSLLEPYLAGCDVYCGPQVERSTEFEAIKEENGALEIVTEVEKLSFDDLSATGHKVDLFANNDFFEDYKQIKGFLG